MADEKGPVDHLLDLFVFGPVGFLSQSRELCPKLAEYGRARLAARIQVARMVGQFALRQGQQEATKAMDRHRAAAPSPSGSAPAASGASSAPGDVVVSLHGDLDEVDGISEADLAIPSYGSLAASQVVSRLEGLAPVELETVRRYEMAHRARKTVLGKIAHLQSQAPG
jgi:hypothetical protein